ncbi:MAG: rRNA pseudouridine synthase [Oscillospiraceae bacterium]|nr:rRNA pseudouridine synthase [Oscillospiraceae bacterium]
MKERIQKILSQRGVASRRQAEQMILDGRISCNGAVCALGDVADADTDTLLLDGKPLPSKGKSVYIMLNKPKGYVTTLSDEKNRKNVAQLVAQCGARVYPVGRLDMDSEGLLLLTNDGDFANRIMHPRGCVDKIYSVEVKGYTPQRLEQLKKPIYLDGYRIAPPQVNLVSSDQDLATIRITIHEGRNRQVRRMCARAGMQVKRLIRIQEGTLRLGNLPSGMWRFLTADELEAMQDEA